MKRLIVNADDYGLSESVNIGIMEAVEKGIVTSVSLMACGRAFAHAVSLLKSHGIRQVGLHLVLNEEMPVLDCGVIPSLTGNNGLFLSRMVFLNKLIFQRAINLHEIRKELEAQIKKCLSVGIVISHFDGHGHAHVYPYIAEIVSGLGRKYGVLKVRIPYESFFLLGKEIRIERLAAKSIVSTFSLMSRRTYKQLGFSFPECFFGLIYGGRLRPDLLNDLLNRLPEGKTTEIMTHPGYYNRESMQIYDYWGYHWEDELNSMLSCSKKALEVERQVKMISFEEIS